MKSTIVTLLIVAAAGMLAVAGYKAMTFKPLKVTEVQFQDGEADEICYSLLKDWSEDPDMREKVQAATVDDLFTDDECQDLLKYHNLIDAQEKRARMDHYMEDAKANVKQLLGFRYKIDDHQSGPQDQCSWPNLG